MKDGPLTDSEFVDLDDQLYSMINSILFNNDLEMNMNAEPKLFDWYCEIRDNLCQQIHDKKEQLIKPQANQQKGTNDTTNRRT